MWRFFFSIPLAWMARISHNRLAIFALQNHHKTQNPSGTAYQQAHRAVQLRPSFAAECHHRWSQHSVLVCMAPGVGIRALWLVGLSGGWWLESISPSVSGRWWHSHTPTPLVTPAQWSAALLVSPAWLFASPSLLQ